MKKLAIVILGSAAIISATPAPAQFRPIEVCRVDRNVGFGFFQYFSCRIADMMQERFG